jgi:hypothetical protein
MFGEWRERRRLKRQLADITRRYEPRLDVANREERESIEDERESEMASPFILLEMLETERLLRKARKLGIEYQSDQTWWAENEITEQSWLTQRGHAKLRKLIRDERFSIAEKLVKILVPVLTALVSILGLLVALITVSRSNK